MIKRVFKWFWAWDFENKYEYRLELLEKIPYSTESQDYIDLMKETGVEFVSSCLRWACFRKKVGVGKFEIYSDLKSKINHYKRIRALLLLVTPMSIWSIFNNMMNYKSYGFNGDLILSTTMYSLSSFIDVRSI